MGYQLKLSLIYIQSKQSIISLMIRLGDLAIMAACRSGGGDCKSAIAVTK